MRMPGDTSLLRHRDKSPHIPWESHMETPTERGYYWIVLKGYEGRPEVARWENGDFHRTVPNGQVASIIEVLKWRHIEPPADFLEAPPT
jgi:hypothetical protein